MEKTENSNYEMLGFYNENNEFDLVGGLIFYFDGEIAYEHMKNSVTVGTWTPKKWYNVKAEVDLNAKKVIYYLDHVKIQETIIDDLNKDITEVDFSFDNYGSSFFVDNVTIIDLENLGLTENNKNPISIYPNPSSTYININTTEKIKTVTVTDLTGKIILNQQDSNKIDIHHLSNGVYLININTDNSQSIQKFIKK